VLTGLSALVTGAGSGIGRAIALRLARLGAAVWVTDLSDEAATRVSHEIRLAGGTCQSRVVDVTRRADVEHVADDIWFTHGRIDLVVANAGVSTMNHFLDLTEKEWDHVFEVNTKGVFLTMQVCARRMVRQEYIPHREIRGKIVVTGSMAARCAAPLLAHYSASKFAVLGLVQAAAKELAPHRILVNAVNPGYVRTAMQEREVIWESSLRGVSPDEVVRGYVSATPLGRLETPEDVAGCVAFLCGPESDFLTGEAIEVNGGAWIA
jgi:meso-butanediol dehydrogenase/(S,S)-butanediol dehydrogenase/diacetyl reductase